jgi:hypothetical protein
MIDLILAGVADGGVEQQSTPETSASGVAWPAIIGGAFAAIALTLLLFTLGSGFGLASVSPWPNVGASVGTFTVVTAVWLIVLHWLASGLGGYITGRLRTKWVGLHTHEVFFRDTANGFLSWAVATVFGAAMVAIGAAIVITGTAAAATGTAPSAFPSAYLLDSLFRTDRPGIAGQDTDFKAQSRQIILNGISAGDVPAADNACGRGARQRKGGRGQSATGCRRRPQSWGDPVDLHGLGTVDRGLRRLRRGGPGWAAARRVLKRAVDIGRQGYHPRLAHQFFGRLAVLYRNDIYRSNTYRGLEHQHGESRMTNPSMKNNFFLSILLSAANAAADRALGPPPTVGKRQSGEINKQATRFSARTWLAAVTPRQR